MLTSLRFYLAALAAFATIFFLASYQENSTMTTQVISIPHVDAKGDYQFAGERVPVENFDVRERLERELVINSYLHSSTILNVKNSARYFPVIEPILKEYGLPDDIKYLAVAESNFRNTASGAGAKGVWQFMEGTAGDYGMEVSDEVDERLHLEKATRAACQYLKRYKERFGSWTLAAAAYNMGAGGLSKEIDNQRFSNYYDLSLNEETNRYIFRIVAIKEVLSQPEKFDFEIKDEHVYQPLDNYSIVTVDSTIANLGDFAKRYGTTYRMLKVYNPWLRSYKLSNSKRKTYELKIPKPE